jgi:hypothetical protein
MMHSLIGTLNSQKAAAAGGGGFDSYVKSLLHFNGTNYSNTFTDETGKIWTGHGPSMTLVTAIKKFGTASCYFDGNADYMDTPAHTDFNSGSNNFTIDYWVQRADASTVRVMVGQNNSAADDSSRSFRILWNSNNKPVITVYSTSSTPYTTSAGSTAVTADGIFHHIAAVRNGNVLKLYLDGITQGTVDVTGVTVRSSSSKLTLGRAGEYNGNYFNGWLDEFRLSNGIARWTDDFIPYAQEYAA